MNSQLLSRKLQPAACAHVVLLPPLPSRAVTPSISSTRCCQCSSLPSTSAGAGSAYRTACSSFTSSLAQHSQRPRTRCVLQAKRASRSPSADLPEDEEDPLELGQGAEDDLALDSEEGREDPFLEEEGDDEGGFDEPLEEEEEPSEEGAPDEYEDDDEEPEEEGPAEGETGGEQEEEREPLPFEIEDIGFEEFAKRSKPVPFSAQRANIQPLTEEEIRAIEPQDDNKGMVIPEGAQLSLNRQGYQAFQMGDIEFLVAETPDGKMDLRDSFVFDGGPEIYARPEMSGDLPELPIMLQAIPWIERKSGDMLKQKEGFARMKKVFFVGVQTLRPYRMALDQVFKFEASSRQLSRETVRTVGKPADPILRIRADGLTIEDSGQIPTPSQMLQQGDVQPLEEPEEARQERLKDMEEREELEKLDEEPDVPASDMS